LGPYQRKEKAMNASLTFSFVVAALLFSVGSLFAQALPSNVPLPGNVLVMKPAEDLPPDVKAFSGKWVGSWDGVLDHVLVVEEISSLDRVRTVYAFGTAETWSIWEPGFFRPIGKVTPGTLVINVRGATVTYSLHSPDELRGTHERQGRFNRITMKRVKE
jgi:hypothetical protein